MMNTKQNRKSPQRFRPKQNGLVAMTGSMILLTAITAATFVSSKNVSMVSRSANQQYQATQAFDAAEAGLEYATNFVLKNKSTLIVDSNSSGFIDTNSTTGKLCGTNTNYTFSVSNVQNGNLDIIKVTATGTSSDGTVSRTVSQLMSFYPLLKLASIPNLPVTAKKKVTMVGSSDVNNCTHELGIWAGGSSRIVGNAQVNTTGNNNIKDNDHNLSSASLDKLFKNYFGASMASVKNQSIVKVSKGKHLCGTKGVFHWVKPSGNGRLQITSSTTIGTVNKPVIIVVEGDMKVAGRARINGFIFVTGKFDISGNARVNGAVVANGDVITRGTSAISYDLDILTKAASGFGTYAKVPGSWNDQ